MPRRKQVFAWLKRLLFVVVLLFVLRQGWKIAGQADWSQLPLRPGWLIPAAAAYWVGWLPSAWFWRQLLKSVGQPARWYSVVRAYYCGHLGKYVPGKAMVLVLRSGLLRCDRVGGLSAALTATYETLLMMAVGLGLGLTVLPWSMPKASRAELTAAIGLPADSAQWLPVITIVAAVVALPLISRLFQRVAWSVSRKEMSDGGEPPAVQIPTRLVLLGIVVLSAGWFCLGASLACTLRSVGGPELQFSDWPFWTGVVSFATAAGFLAVFAPGGLGVREALLVAAILWYPGVEKPQALAAAVVLRGLWLIAEVLAAAALYAMAPTDISTDAERASCRL